MTPLASLHHLIVSINSCRDYCPASCDDDIIIVFLHICHVFFINHVIKARDDQIYSRSKIIQQSYSKSYTTNHTAMTPHERIAVQQSYNLLTAISPSGVRPLSDCKSYAYLLAVYMSDSLLLLFNLYLELSIFRFLHVIRLRLSNVPVPIQNLLTYLFTYNIFYQFVFLIFMHAF